MQTVAIETIWPTLDAATHTALLDADIVVGVDRNTGKEFTLYGLPSLESSASLKRPSAMKVVQIAFDHSDQQLSELMSLVRRLKPRDA